jgi:hypothetical protein
MRFTALLILAALFPQIQACHSPSKKFVPPKGTLVVVHPTNYYAQMEAQDEINAIVNQHLDAKQTVITLVETEQQIADIKNKKKTKNGYTNYLQRIDETTLMLSLNGENQIQLEEPHVTIAGGYLLACLKVATRNLVRENFKRFDQLNVTLPFYAVYGKGQRIKAGARLETTLVQHFKRQKFPSTLNLTVHLDKKVIFKQGQGRKSLNVFLKSPEKKVQQRQPSGRIVL